MKFSFFISWSNIRTCNFLLCYVRFKLFNAFRPVLRVCFRFVIFFFLLLCKLFAFLILPYAVAFFLFHSFSLWTVPKAISTWIMSVFLLSREKNECFFSSIISFLFWCYCIWFVWLLLFLCWCCWRSVWISILTVGHFFIVNNFVVVVEFFRRLFIFFVFFFFGFFLLLYRLLLDLSTLSRQCWLNVM